MSTISNALASAFFAHGRYEVRDDGVPAHRFGVYHGPRSVVRDKFIASGATQRNATAVEAALSAIYPTGLPIAINALAELAGPFCVWDSGQQGLRFSVYHGRTLLGGAFIIGGTSRSYASAIASALNAHNPRAVGMDL